MFDHLCAFRFWRSTYRIRALRNPWHLKCSRISCASLVIFEVETRVTYPQGFDQPHEPLPDHPWNHGGSALDDLARNNLIEFLREAKQDGRDVISSPKSLWAPMVSRNSLS